MREAKLDILENAWNKLLGQIHDNNTIILDKKTEKLIIEIGKVSQDARRYTLSEYLRCT